jgi:hypothetical protein
MIDGPYIFLLVMDTISHLLQYDSSRCLWYFLVDTILIELMYPHHM